MNKSFFFQIPFALNKELDPKSVEFRNEAKTIEGAVSKALGLKGIEITFKCCPPKLIIIIKAKAADPDVVTGDILVEKMTSAIASDAELMGLAVQGQTFSAEGNI